MNEGLQLNCFEKMYGYESMPSYFHKKVEKKREMLHEEHFIKA